MFFSIIIPIYNVEKYLKKCIDSLLNQKFKNFEILLIDDCSTDNSLRIANSYSNIDNVIIIKKKKNTGLSDSRNIGLKKANGEYIMFVDSDDYVEEECLNTLFGIINNNKFPDIVYTGYYEEKDGKSTRNYGYVSEKNKLFLGHSFIKSELEKRTLYAAACFGVYRRTLFKKNNLYFKNRILHEDELWTPQVVYNSKSIYTSDYIFYHYVRRTMSITKSKNRMKNGMDLIDSSLELDLLFSNIEDIYLRKLINNHIAMLYMKAMCIGGLYKKEFKSKIDRSYPLKKTCFRKDKIKAIIFLLNLKAYYFLDHRFGDNI